MFYFKTNNTAYLKDNKNGSRMYLQYNWTNDKCGSDTDACDPRVWNEAWNNASHAGFVQKHGPLGQQGTWLLYRLCHDNFGPNLCGTEGRWRRTTA